MERKGESVEARGRNVEEAIAAGLSEMGMSRDQVEIEILNRGSRGVLGLGAEEARVLLTPVKSAPAQPAAPVAAPPVVQPVEAPRPVAPAPRPAAAPVPAQPASAAAPKPPASAGTEEEEEGPLWEGDAAAMEQVEETARQALAGLLSHMSIQATVVVKKATGLMAEETHPTPIVLDIEGDDLGVLIGRRGETLSALQYLVRLIVNRQTRRWVNIVVDVEGYKERREHQLRQLAERMAERVVATQKSVVLEAMPPYERRIVHLTLKEHPTVTTHSIGEGDSRKVMILLR